MKNLLDELEFVIVPLVNPDGYVVSLYITISVIHDAFFLLCVQYSWTHDRLWRKNRRVNSGSLCRGVNLDRNYNDHWNEVCV